MQRRLQKLFGPDRLLRDFATFTTERGEPAVLALFVTAASKPGRDPETVTFAITLERTGAPVDGVELHLPIDADLQSAKCNPVVPATLSEVRTSTWGIDALLTGLPPDLVEMTLLT